MAGEKITLRLPVNTNSSLNAGERAWNPQLYEFIRRHPELEIKGESGVAIPGQWEAGRLMAIAGGIAPDVMNVWPYQIEQYIDEGFLAPLDDFIGFDRNGDGVLDRQEVHWDGWWKIPESIRNRLFRNGHVWAIPQPLDFMMAFVYRKDLWQKAGLNPNKPPRSFDEFYRALQMLSYPDINVKGASRQLGQMALLRPSGEMLYPLIWSAGGEEILQGKTNPATGKTYWFGRDETRFADPQTGETLTRYPSEWKSNFNSPAGRKAAEFIHKLAFGKWSRDPVTGEVFDLKDNVRQGMEVVSPSGNPLRLTSENLRTGVIRKDAFDDYLSMLQGFARGEVAMLFIHLEPFALSNIPLPMSSLGILGPPAAPSSSSIPPTNLMFMGINQSAGKDPAKRKLCWEYIALAGSPENQVKRIRGLATAGYAAVLPPSWLRMAGLVDFYEDLPVAYRESYDQLAANARLKPTNPGWGFVDNQILKSSLLDPLLENESVDIPVLLAETDRRINDSVLRKNNSARLSKYRSAAWCVAGIIGLAAVAVGMWLLRNCSRKSDAGGERLQRRKLIFVALLLTPAAGSILLWQYYPLIRGGIMAFQETHLITGGKFTGLDNFILAFTNPDFYYYLWNTLKYVMLALGIGFAIPIILAVLLSEIPVGGLMFRLIYYLPTMTSGLVIMFLWKLMYDPAPKGMLNTLLSYIGVAPQKWLNDPGLAMLCIVLPGIWAAAGGASIIYIAALKSIPEQLYEAADADGAGVFRKLIHITLPTIKPLIIINFVGAFIAAFQVSQTVLVMTGGGPQDATMVLGLNIWLEAFMGLNFGYATSVAWILGSVLIGFTVMQLRILRNLEFKRAED